MLLPDGSVLMHAGAPYDPIKAHEYYLKTRKLHPRQAQAQPAKGLPQKKGNTSYAVVTKTGIVKLSPKQYAEQMAYAHHRVTQIKARLGRLTAELNKRLAAAKKREAAANKPPTAAEKAQAARDAKKYRDSHKQQLANKRNNSKSSGSSSSSNSSSSSTTTSSKPTETVASLKQEIAQARSNLKAAVATQRSLAAAKKNG